MRTRLPAVPVSLVLLLAVAGLVPNRVHAIGPLPDCRIEDILTVPRGYDDWSHTLVDWLLRVEDDYVPPDLTPVGEANLPGGGFVRAVAIDDLRAMGEASRAAGAGIGIWSPYRAYDEQVKIYNDYVAIDGEEASTYSMPPGHSEHQLGLGVDFTSEDLHNPLIGDWAYEAKAGAWMAQHAWEYGWVVSYPIPPAQVGTTNLWSDAVCFTYEPWHYRYLGREVAKAVHDSGLTIREYLWQNFTQLDTNLEPIATPTPTPSPTPSPSPTPQPTPTPSPSPPASPMPSPTPEPQSPVTALLDLDPAVLAAGGVGLLLLLGLIVVTARRSRARG